MNKVGEKVLKVVVTILEHFIETLKMINQLRRFGQDVFKRYCRYLSSYKHSTVTFRLLTCSPC